jgi:hypothetical protein
VDVALPTLAVVLSWLCVGAVLVGCGYLTRSFLLRVAVRSPAGGLRVADLWVGLAVLVAYLQVWSLFSGLHWVVWILPLAAGLTGVALGARRLGRFRVSPRALGVLALPLLGTLWLADRALAPAQDYDLGLYHLNAIAYALRYPAIPGLGNLQERLGAGDAHLLFVSFLQHGPWAGAAPHLANGLLVSMLFLDVAARFARAPGLSSFRNRMALLLVPATVALIGASPGYRVSSPNLDLATFVLVAVGALYAAEAVERGGLPAAALTSTASFALAAATRPLYWLTTVMTGGLLLLGRRPLLRALAVVGALPGALLAGWLARQAVLSGYPFFPTTVAGLPVDWRMPAAAVKDQNRWADSWARWPGKTPDEVLASWHWLSVWLRARAKDLDVIAPLTLLAALVPSLTVARRDGPRPTAPLLVVVVPALASLVVWFLVAPDPRFAFGPIWLVPVALAAWALPPTTRLPTGVLLVSAVVAAGLVWLGVRNLGWFFLAAFDAWALAGIATRLVGRRRLQGLVAQVALVSVALAPVGIVAYGGAFDVVVADQSGPLGTPRTPVPALEPFRTTSGLELSKPAGGADQCWGVSLCAPQPDSRLRLRGTSIRDGFARTPGAAR